MATINVGEISEGVEINPNGREAYVTLLQDNRVAVIDVLRDQIGPLGYITVGTNPWDVAVSAQGDKLYVTNFGDNTVSVVNLGSGDILDILGVGLGPRGIDIDYREGRAHVVNNRNDTVSVIDTVIDRVISTIVVEDAPEQVVAIG